MKPIIQIAKIPKTNNNPKIGTNNTDLTSNINTPVVFTNATANYNYFLQQQKQIKLKPANAHKA